MTRRYIRYRSEYKHQLASDYDVDISIRPSQDVQSQFIDLSTAGALTVKNGYAWDGPSGPVVDTRETLRASLVHDALYQLMRNGHLSARRHRKRADEIFRDMCKADGLSPFYAQVFYKGLRTFGEPATSPERKKRVHRAPKS